MQFLPFSGEKLCEITELTNLIIVSLINIFASNASENQICVAEVSS